VSNFIKVVYITGTRRSGTTLLDILLSNHSDIVGVGELINLDSHISKGNVGWSWKWKCTCGSDFEKCDFWGPIIKEINDIKTRRTRIEPLVLPNPRKVELGKIDLIFSTSKRNIDISHNCWLLYKLISKIYVKKIIVDSSKSVNQLYNLYLLKNNNSFKVIYIRRDIRGVLNSYNKNYKRITPPSEFRKPSTYKNLKIYLGLLKEEINRIKFISRLHKNDLIYVEYERLCDNLEAELKRISNFIGINFQNDMKFFNTKGKHNIGGSPGRFNRPALVKKDEAWKDVIDFKKAPLINFMGIIINTMIKFFINIKNINY